MFTKDVDERLTKFITAFVALTLLTACGDPLEKVDKLSSVDLADDAISVGALPDPAQGGTPTGLFSALLGRRDAPGRDLAVVPPGEAVAMDAAGTVEVPVPKAPKKRGLFAFMRSKEQNETQDPTARLASLGPVPTSQAVEKKSARFGKRAAKHKGPDVQIVPFGTHLPSGVVARVCDLPSGRLGKEVGKFPQRGRGYQLFDSNPGAAGARPFYVSGFDDKCARTFTAALALFGSPTMHEQLRYGLPSSVQPYSTTDKAYEGIKRSVCGAARKKPCGAKIKQLEKDTAFISIYDRIGSNSSWSNVLLHKGWVLAADRKG